MTQREAKNLQSVVKSTEKDFRKEGESYVCDFCSQAHGRHYVIEIDENALDQLKAEKLADGGKFDRFNAARKLHYASDKHKEAVQDHRQNFPMKQRAERADKGTTREAPRKVETKPRKTYVNKGMPINQLHGIALDEKLKEKYPQGQPVFSQDSQEYQELVKEKSKILKQETKNAFLRNQYAPTKEANQHKREMKQLEKAAKKLLRK